MAKDCLVMGILLLNFAVLKVSPSSQLTFKPGMSCTWDVWFLTGEICFPFFCFFFCCFNVVKLEKLLRRSARKVFGLSKFTDCSSSLGVVFEV